jgi:hypothetical protein
MTDLRAPSLHDNSGPLQCTAALVNKEAQPGALSVVPFHSVLRVMLRRFIRAAARIEQCHPHTSFLNQHNAATCSVVAHNIHLIQLPDIHCMNVIKRLHGGAKAPNVICNVTSSDHRCDAQQAVRPAHTVPQAPPHKNLAFC